jgi:hypothetical protein
MTAQIGLIGILVDGHNASAAIGISAILHFHSSQS